LKKEKTVLFQVPFSRHWMMQEEVLIHGEYLMEQKVLLANKEEG
jgi:hypothetical protein